MADYTPIYTVNQLPFTSTTSTTVTGGQMLAVSGTGTVGPAAAGSLAVIGVAGHDAATGARVTVHPLAGLVHEFIAGTGGITAGQSVKVGATANAVLPVSSGADNGQVGIALTTASAAAAVSVLGSAAGGGGGAALFASAALNFAEVAAAGQQELTITVTGAAVGDGVVLAPPAAPEAGLVFNGRVSATNTVTVRASNITASPIDPASATWGAFVIKS